MQDLVRAFQPQNHIECLCTLFYILILEVKEMKVHFMLGMASNQVRHKKNFQYGNQYSDS
jgi:hypothetical protein